MSRHTRAVPREEATGKPIPAVRLLSNDKLFLDGNEFPYYIKENSLEIRREPGDSLTEVTLTILAEDDVVVRR